MIRHCALAARPKQGQYLAFIDAYTRVHRRPPPNANAGIGGHLADEVVRVKIDYAGVTVAAGERGHIVDVRFGRHGLHCGGDIVIDELMPDVSVKDRS